MYTVTQSVMVVVARPGALLDLHLSFFTLLKTVVSCVDKERCYDAALGTECLVLWCFRLLSGY
jgi:predicted membrane-bound dolichyl-phosphate-mannose-protein mannosyltransferase